jgi:uncharacterized repeat protein (TIGR03803 family)
MGLALPGGTVAIIAAVLSTAGVGSHADAASLATLYDFCSLGAPCKDGNGPQAAVLMDAAGNLYGMTVEGGAYNHGAIYKLSPNASRTAWNYTVLHSFCPPGSNVCVDGASPYGRLIMDASGNLYGTTPGGGARGGGTVFELSPNTTRTAWTLTVLYNFGLQSHDPTNSRAGLVMDSSGRLFGASAGGGTYGAGTVFQLAPPGGTQTAWTEKVLYSFGTNGGVHDAGNPYDGLITDGSGKLYGTTLGGGLYGQGTVFALAPPSGTQTAWTESILYDFCAQTKCADGAEPVASLLMDNAGNLYGTTYKGGAFNNGGAVFELTPNAGKIPWKETVLYNFCSKAVCADGAAPWAEVIMDGAGNLYGTTLDGGAKLAGSIFKLTPPTAGQTAWTETVVYSFCSVAKYATCFDGQAPSAGLIMDSAGNFYGTTEAGGLHSEGTVFEYH